MKREPDIAPDGHIRNKTAVRIGQVLGWLIVFGIGALMVIGISVVFGLF